MKKSTVAIIIILIILALDQWLKIWIKTNMYLQEEFLLFGLDWARIHFIENPGMAFGMTFGGDIGKLILSVFRIIMIGFLIYYLRMLIKMKVSWGIVIGIAMILAGAIGNILDSVFYGLIFNSPHPGRVAEFVAFGEGYSSFLHGKVVDMFFFPLFSGHYPDWIPYLGGKSFLFFRPVFNVADSAITVGIFYMLIFHRKFISSGDIKDDRGHVKSISPTTEASD